MEGQHSMWPKEKDGLRCPPRGRSLQGLGEVKGESRRWSVGGQQTLIQTLPICEGQGHRREGASY